MVHGDVLCAALVGEGGDRVSRGCEHADDACKGDDGDEECEYLARLVAWACLLWSAGPSGETAYPGNSVALAVVVCVGEIIADVGVFFMEGVCAERVAVHRGRGRPWRVWRHGGGSNKRGSNNGGETEMQMQIIRGGRG